MLLLGLVAVLGIKEYQWLSYRAGDIVDGFRQAKAPELKELSATPNWDAVAFLPERGLINPLLVDVSQDGLADILVLDRQGKLTAINGDTGAPLYIVNLPSASSKAFAATPWLEDQALVAINHSTVSLYNHLGEKRWDARTILPELVFAPLLNDVNADGFPDVIASSQEQGLVALDGQYGGRKLWSVNFKEPQGFGAKVLQLQPSVNASSSFLMAGEQGELKAIDIVSGRPVDRWTTNLGPILIAAPTLSRGDQSIVAVYTQEQKLIGLDAVTGNLLWQVAVNDLVTATPLSLRLNTDPQQDILILTQSGDMLAYDGLRGELLWRQSTGLPLQSPPALIDLNDDSIRDIVIAQSSGSVAAFDGLSGQQLAELVVSENEPLVFTPLLAENTADGKVDVIVLSQAGKLHSMSTPVAVPRGTTLWTHDTGSNFHGE
ncbi:hypothetical protein BST96_02795 [Oceanicoccus sagamiensis]|uniref:Pyrrolo-quinoline quinone repeat domain-containing protein n=1 Tax=Oceanicoccus sagamiensis TaxID=716816 RepID=A0A1X9N5X4_9GAMM|nr:hypothetical protein BST96_02795 [Oceanicoccus sagamiensis]